MSLFERRISPHACIAGSNPAARHASPIAFEALPQRLFSSMESSHARISSARPGGSSFPPRAGFDREPGKHERGILPLRDRPYCLGILREEFAGGGRCERDRVPPDRCPPNAPESGPARYRFESMSTSPYLSAVPAFPANRVERRGRQRHQRGPLLVEHLGHGHVRQPRATRVPSASPSHRSSRRRLNCPYDSARMGGTMRLRRKTDRVLPRCPSRCPSTVAEPTSSR